MKGLSLVGALLGGLAGAVIWLIAVAIDGSPLGVLALGVGAAVAAGAILLNSTPGGAVPAALITLGFCLLAKFGGIPIALDSIRSSIKDTFDHKQYDLYMADADAFAHMTPAQVQQWLPGRSPYDKDDDGEISADEQETFNRFWAPRLTQWAQNPPTVETWAPQITEDWHKESGQTADAKAVFVQFFGPWQLLFLALAVVGAHQAVARISLEEARERRRGTGKITPGVIDLNEDIGSGIDIKMAAPGQSARKPEAKPDAKPAAKPQAKPAAKPAPRKQDRPPGM